MRIYWWNGGLHIRPETKEDNERVKALMEIFKTAKIGPEENLGSSLILRSESELPQSDIGTTSPPTSV